MLNLRPCWRLIAPAVMSAVAVACSSPAAPASDPALFEGPGRVSFAALGWSEDQAIAPGASAVVRFRLPEGARQGDPLSYGITLKFEWTGTPGAVGDYAYLNGRWNEGTLYQFQVKRVTDLDDGFEWSMVDAINGDSWGYELGETFRASSSNLAQLRSVQGGWNEVGLSLRLRDAGNDDIKVIISKESEIFATSWPPTTIEGGAKTKVEDNVIDLAVAGQNRGWAAPRLLVTAMVWSGPHHDRFTWDLGPLAPLGAFDLSERLVLAPEREPLRIDVALEWGSGRHSYTAWDASLVSGRPRFIAHRVFRSTVGVLAAIVVLWVCVPMLISAAWGSRRT